MLSPCGKEAVLFVIDLSTCINSSYFLLASFKLFKKIQKNIFKRPFYNKMLSPCGKEAVLFIIHSSRTQSNRKRGTQGGRQLSRDVNKPVSLARQFHYFVVFNYVRKLFMVVCRRPCRCNKGELGVRVCHGVVGPPPAPAWRVSVAGEGEVWEGRGRGWSRTLAERCPPHGIIRSTRTKSCVARHHSIHMSCISSISRMYGTVLIPCSPQQ